ncbi:MAG: hypothetical protein C5B51_16210 [Terriglobia bacterium]|nr:MAG: hypothetical protein C5B51_16210 [Terriglobia bacterium]
MAAGLEDPRLFTLMAVDRVQGFECSVALDTRQQRLQPVSRHAQAATKIARPGFGGMERLRLLRLPLSVLPQVKSKARGRQHKQSVSGERYIEYVFLLRPHGPCLQLNAQGQHRSASPIP